VPKVRELGITVVPAGFGPLAIGRGGWCGGTVCSDCTLQPFSLCGGTQRCVPVSVRACAGGTVCTDCTRQPLSICGGTRQCFGATNCGFVSGTPVQNDPRLTKAQIEQLRAQLKQQLETLDEHERALLPKTLDGLDAREKEIAAELEQLKGVRAQLKKK